VEFSDWKNTGPFPVCCWLLCIIGLPLSYETSICVFNEMNRHYYCRCHPSSPQLLDKIPCAVGCYASSAGDRLSPSHETRAAFSTIRTVAVFWHPEKGANVTVQVGSSASGFSRLDGSRALLSTDYLPNQ